MTGKTGKNTVEAKLNSVLKAIETMSARLDNLEKHFASFKIQLNEIDKNFSERCGKLEADVSALDLNINRLKVWPQKMKRKWSPNLIYLMKN